MAAGTQRAAKPQPKRRADEASRAQFEREWSAELGTGRFAKLKELLFHVWNSPLSR